MYTSPTIHSHKTLRRVALGLFARRFFRTLFLNTSLNTIILLAADLSTFPVIHIVGPSSILLSSPLILQFICIQSTLFGLGFVGIQLHLLIDFWDLRLALSTLLEIIRGMISVSS